MNASNSTPDAARELRQVHLTMLAGLVVTGGGFAYLVQTGGALDSSPTVATVVTIVSIALLAFAALVLRPRIPARRSDEAPNAYWDALPHRRAVMALWAVTEVAGVLGAFGYFFTGIVWPVVATGLAFATLLVFRPSSLEGAA